MAEKRLPGRERRKRHGRRLDVVECFRLGREIVRMDGNEIRSAAIAIERSEAVYFFAGPFARIALVSSQAPRARAPAAPPRPPIMAAVKILEDAVLVSKHSCRH